MKIIKVIAAGLYGAGGLPIKVGTEYRIESDVPPGWKHKVEQIEADADSDTIQNTEKTEQDIESKNKDEDLSQLDSLG
mgnify:CR=1 FL=1